jgi:MoaA/NifB/PqqE/SkfB family radical SAM enzyme
LKTDECFRLISQAAGAGATRVVLTGGEPTIRKDFPQLLHYCHRMGLTVEIQTNGRRLRDSSYCGDLEILKLDSFSVAIHGPNASIHDEITRRPESYADTRRALSNLATRSWTAVGKVVISRLNAQHLLDTLNCLHRMNVRSCNFAFPHYQGVSTEMFNRVVPRYSDLREVFLKLLDESQRLGILISFETVPFCIIPGHPGAIAELSFLGSEQRFFTPVREPTMDWMKVRRAIKKKEVSCQVCSFDLICEGPWEEYVDNFGFKEFVPLEFDAAVVTKLLGAVIRKGPQ